MYKFFLFAVMFFIFLSIPSFAYTKGNPTLNITYDIPTNDFYGKEYTSSCLAECDMPINITVGGTAKPLTFCANNLTWAKAKTINDNLLYVAYEYLTNDTYTYQVWSPDVTCTGEGNSTACVDNGHYDTIQAWMFIWKPLAGCINLNNLYGLNLHGYRKASLKASAIDIVPSMYSLSLPELAWWNTSFERKKNITVNTTKTVSEYPLGMNVTYDSNMQADFDDIRFTNSTETGELKYWIEQKVDSSWAYVWVRGNWSDTNGTQAYMYYGNSTLSTTSNGKATFPYLFDDFDDASINNTIWQNTSSVAESGGVITVTGVGSPTWNELNSIEEFPNNTCMIGNVSASSFDANTAWYFGTTHEASPFYSFQWGYPVGSKINARSYNGSEYPNSNYTFGGQTGYQRLSICRRNATHQDYSVNFTNISTSGTSATTTVTFASSISSRMSVLTNTLTLSADYWFVRNYSYPEPEYDFGEEATSGTITAVNLYLNGTEANATYGYGNATNATALINITGLWVAIARNGTLISNGTTSVKNVNMTAAGYWNYTAWYPGNVTYTASSKTIWINITNATPTLTITKNVSSWFITYPNSTSITGTGCPTQLTCNFYRNNTAKSNPENILLGGAAYNYVYNTTGNENYTDSSSSQILNVSPGTPTHVLSFNTSTPVAQYSIVNVSCLNVSTAIKMYNDTGEIANNFVFNATFLGTYNYTCNNTADANWTSSNDSESLSVVAAGSLIIHKAYDERNTTKSFNFSVEIFNSTYSTKVSNNETYSSNEIKGNMTIIVSATGYGTRYYYANIPVNSTYNMSAYLVNSSEGQNILFTIQNYYDQPIENANITFYRLLPTWTIVSTGFTDSSGKLNFFADPNANYKIIISKSGYSNKEVTLIPSQTTYTIILPIGGINLPSYWEAFNGWNDTCTFDNTTPKVECAWNDTSGHLTNVTMKVWRLGMNTSLLCENTTTNNNGTFTCLLPTINNVTYSWGIYSKHSSPSEAWLLMDSGMATLYTVFKYGLLGVFITFVITLTFGFFALQLGRPSFLIFSTLMSIIFCFILGFISPFETMASAVIGLIFSGVIIMMKSGG